LDYESFCDKKTAGIAQNHSIGRKLMRHQIKITPAAFKKINSDMLIGNFSAPRSKKNENGKIKDSKQICRRRLEKKEKIGYKQTV